MRRSILATCVVLTTLAARADDHGHVMTPEQRQETQARNAAILWDQFVSEKKAFVEDNPQCVNEWLRKGAKFDRVLFLKNWNEGRRSAKRRHEWCSRMFGVSDRVCDALRRTPSEKKSDDVESDASDPRTRAPDQLPCFRR